MLRGHHKKMAVLLSTTRHLRCYSIQPKHNRSQQLNNITASCSLSTCRNQFIRCLPLSCGSQPDQPWRINSMSWFRSNSVLGSPSLRRFHTTPKVNNDSDDDNEPYFEYRFIPSIPFLWAWFRLKFFTSIEFDVDEFTEGALEACYFLLGNLRQGNIQDIEECLTEKGVSDCQKLLIGTKSADLQLEKNELKLLGYLRLNRFSADGMYDQARLQVVLACICTPSGAGDEGLFHQYHHRRMFTVTYLVFLDEEGKQCSDWFIDGMRYKKLSGAGRKQE